MYTTDNRRRIRLAIVSPTPPRPCPVATFTDELCRMLPLVAPRIGLTVYVAAGDPAALAAAVEGVLADPAPAAGRWSSVRAAEQLAGLVGLVASRHSAPPADGRRTAA